MEKLKLIQIQTTYAEGTNMTYMWQELTTAKYLKGVYYTGIKLFRIFLPYTCI
jgi:hypothetical protein